ncbi:peptidase S8 and S53, subtilisin, kexin, sedolisin [Seminavis robusta]|uniref:Peptidase S8 and S53, subtilisin, kexin, sedolisin n=1 Tax=Seminavis robusta TaxID=568900 RepID=A0A9N8EMX2_9STRA|nr:peptidase S8 and S53, subtilisin, kexin, sedolisin [Seminavis robusta]|eukprot:Sro1246_g255810.1 peptidase S8 and S53, subtilisin, kexin, sedolisin (552) ;mRNA; f:26914-28569
MFKSVCFPLLLLLTGTAARQLRRNFEQRVVPRQLQQPFPRSTTALQEGVVTTVLNGNSFDESTFVLANVPAGQRVTCKMTGDGNVNMAGRYGAEPTNLNYDCIGYIAGTSEEGCGFYAAKEETSVFITTYAFSNFERIDLTCSYVDVVELENGNGLTGQASPTPGFTTFYKLDTPVKVGENVSCSLLGGNGNANLYLKYGSDPEIFRRAGDGFDCESRAAGSNEECTLDGPTENDADLHVAIDTMAAYDNLTVTCASPIGYASAGRGEDGCFSADTTVTVKGKGTVPMTDLQVGDLVMTTTTNSYEPIYAFGHFHKTLPMEYLQIRLEGVSNQKPLEVTGNHLLFVQGRTDPVAADSIQVGDVLSKGQQQEHVVTSITTVTKAGAYLPLTPSGTILVNDGTVVASTYVSIAKDAPVIVQAFLKILSEQSLFHAWMAPTRMLCQYVSNSYCQSTSPTTINADDGILTWLHAGLALAKFGEQQVPNVQAVGMLLALTLLAVFVSLEAMIGLTLGTWYGLLLSVVCISGLASSAKASYKNPSRQKRTVTPKKLD